MAGVYLCSDTNSTLFTECCDCAICNDEIKCPKCGGIVYPESARERWDYAMRNRYGSKKLQEMRDQAKRLD